jgi:hypothetical protein
MCQYRCRKGATVAAAVAAAAAAAQQAAAVGSGTSGHSIGSHSRGMNSGAGHHYSSSTVHSSSLATQLIEKGILDACRAVSYTCTLQCVNSYNESADYCAFETQQLWLLGVNVCSAVTTVVSSYTIRSSISRYIIAESHALALLERALHQPLQNWLV